MNVVAEMTALRERTRRPLAAGRRRPHQGHARPRRRGRRGARARPGVGRDAPSGVDAGADERARASGPLHRASPLAVADRHADERGRAGTHAATPAMATAPSLARRARTPDADAITNGAPRPQSSSQRQRQPRLPSVRVTPRISLTMALVAIWAAGVLAVVGRLVVGLIAVQWMSRRTVRVVDAPWLPLARGAGLQPRHHAAPDVPRKRPRHHADGGGHLHAVGADAGGCEPLAARAAAHRPAARARAREAPRLPDARHRAARLRAALVQPARLDCRAAHQDRARTGV